MTRKRNVRSQAAKQAAEDNKEYVTVAIDDQWFGIPVLTVQDVLGETKIASIPLAPPEVAGSLNLRGRIVTAVNPRVRLGLPEKSGHASEMSIVVEYNGELYSLMIDIVGEVLSLPAERFERNPTTLDPRWREISAGIYRLDDRLLVVMDVGRLLDFGKEEAAA
jgi:purine-binding chemotaxis protein CheW